MDAVKSRKRRKQPTRSFRDRLKDQWETLSPREQAIADYILTTFPQAAFESVHAVASAAQTSARTTIRFLQKLGYSGFGDFQAELREDIERRLSSPMERLRLQVGEGWPSESSDGAVESILGEAIENLSSVSRLDPQLIAAAAGALSQAQGDIFVFGAGKAAAVAAYMWFEVALVKERCRLLDGSELEVMDALVDLSPHDLVVIFDFRRYPRLGPVVASLAEERGAHLIAIADADMTPAGVRADQTLVVRTQSPSMFDSYIGAFALVSVITHLAELELPRDQLAKRLSRYESVADHASLFTARPRPRSRP
jgi:DNA-binding MurR/RpiR family transcriptional regulator